MSGTFFFCLIIGAGLVAPWFARRISMLVILGMVVLGLAVAAYFLWARGFVGYDQLEFLPVVAATSAAFVTLGLRGTFLVMQGQGIQYSTPQKVAALVIAFVMFTVFFALNM